MTNREWVNSLNNEQYVKFLRTFKENMCDCCSVSSPVLCDVNCFYRQVTWLDMEHDDDGWEERDYRYCV